MFPESDSEYSGRVQVNMRSLETPDRGSLGFSEKVNMFIVITQFFIMWFSIPHGEGVEFVNRIHEEELYTQEAREVSESHACEVHMVTCGCCCHQMMSVDIRTASGLSIRVITRPHLE